MKKLLVILAPLAMAGCQALKDGVGYVEEGVLAPPNAVMEALKAILTFIEGLLGGAINLILHSILPF